MQHDVSHRLMDLPFTAGFVTRKILSPVHQLDVKVQSAEAGGEAGGEAPEAVLQV